MKSETDRKKNDGAGSSAILSRSLAGGCPTERVNKNTPQKRITKPHAELKSALDEKHTKHKQTSE